MAYRATRSKKVVEDFELVNENGTVEHTLHVELDAGSTVEKIRQRYVDLVRAQSRCAGICAEKNSAEELQTAYTDLGEAVVAIIEAVFGTKDGEKIIAFYDSNYVDMVKQVIPFISGVVLPKLDEIAQQYKKDILASYNRKQRRKFMKVMK